MPMKCPNCDAVMRYLSSGKKYITVSTVNMRCVTRKKVRQQQMKLSLGQSGRFIMCMRSPLKFRSIHGQERKEAEEGSLLSCAFLFRSW